MSVAFAPPAPAPAPASAPASSSLPSPPSSTYRTGLILSPYHLVGLDPPPHNIIFLFDESLEVPGNNTGGGSSPQEKGSDLRSRQGTAIDGELVDYATVWSNDDTSASAFNASDFNDARIDHNLAVGWESVTVVAFVVL